MYETFSVLSGICMLALAFAPRLSTKDRAWSAAGGVFFLVYGLYVAAQTTGTFYFPVVIFVVPFAVVGYGLLKLFAGDTASGTPASAPAPPAATGWTPASGQRSPAELAALAPASYAGGVVAAGQSGHLQCVRIGCPRQGWRVHETACGACQQATQPA